MAYQPLTPEQFQAAQKAGFSNDQIIANEKVRMQQEGTPAPSTMQKVGAFASNVGNALTSSEQTFGKGLSTVFDTNTQKTVDDISQQENAGQQALINKIHTETDPVKRQNLTDFLKKQYGTDYKAPVATDINPAFGMSYKQVAGAAFGTALDVLSAGSYGEAAKGAETGKLLTKSPTIASFAEKAGLGTTLVPKAVPVAEQAVKTTLGQTLKNIGIKTAQKTAVGAGTGYAFDVANNLQADKSGGDIFKPGAGTITGGVVPLAIGGVEAGNAITKSISKEMAPKFVNSLIKPKQADFAYGKNPGQTVSQMGITGNSLDDFTKNIGKAKDEVGAQIGEIYKSPANAGATVNASGELKKLDNAIQEAAKGGKNNQGIVSTLQNIKDGLLYEHGVNGDGNIVRLSEEPRDLSKLSTQEAFDLKQKIASHTQFTGRASDDKTVNATLKSMYGGLKDNLNRAVETNNPEIRDLNQKYADLTSAELATKNRDAIVKRADMISLKTGASGAIGTTAALLAGTAALPATLVGISAAGLEKAMETTAVKTRIAAWLGSESPNVIDKIIATNPAIKNMLYRALPKAASSTQAKPYAFGGKR